MYKGSDLVGKPIITFDTGEQIEKVKDVFFNAEEKRLLALLVEEGGVFAKTRVLPFANVKVIGRDAVTIESADAIVVAETNQEINSAIATETIIKGSKVMTEGGEYLGTIKDIFFDQTSGDIKGYDISGGVWNDAYTGKSFLPAERILKMGKDVMFVPNDVSSLLEQQVGGIKGASQQANSKIKEKTSGMPSSEDLRSKSMNAGETAYSNLQEGGEQLKQKASQFWETLKGKTTEYKDQAQEKQEQNKVKNALGKSTSRVILNEQDELILDVGELITHRSIQQARDAGVLDILLDSVSNEPISYADARAKAMSNNEKATSARPDEMEMTDTTMIIEKTNSISTNKNNPDAKTEVRYDKE